mgnify:CR=1 FL=1
MGSQIGQDRFVIEVLESKRNGTFVDIGCYHPTKMNNTVLLETDYGWNGISLDLFLEDWGGEETYNAWKTERPRSTVMKSDALEIDFCKLFADNNLPYEIDYLSIDLDPPEITFEVLKRLPLDEYVFRVITFEHDEYRMSKEHKEATRNFLREQNYVLVREANNQDDFYVHQSKASSIIRNLCTNEMTLDPLELLMYGKEHPNQ